MGHYKQQAPISFTEEAYVNKVAAGSEEKESFDRAGFQCPVTRKPKPNNHTEPNPIPSHRTVKN
jgi:hypothetical protein